jgi:thiamine biosynthesis lipoprotein
MGTRVSMRLWLDDPTKAKAAASAMTEAFNEIARIESIASEWQPDSELSRLNDAAGGDPMKISPELFAILERAKEVSEDTEGKFDVSFHSVGQLWSFKAGASPPSDQAIAEKLPLVNYRRIELDAQNSSARLAEVGMKVGLGAIAKGYAVDAASRLLRERGFGNHIVEGGGDTYARGRKGEKDWQIGVQHPSRGGAIGALPCGDKAVVTSGNYMRFFEWEGRRYTHILDPQTGWPISAEKHPKSVTCVADNATDADAYCTALTIMGRDAALDFVTERPGLDVIVIDFDDSIHVSAGLEGRWRRFDEPPKAAN